VKSISLVLSLPSKARGSLEVSIGIASVTLNASVTPIASYSFEARGLKFGMKICFINAMKL